MKFIVALVKPFKVEEVRDALVRLSIGGMTITEAKGNGHGLKRSEVFRGVEYAIDLVPKARIEIAVSDEIADRAVAAIQLAAHTGRPGDGKVFVYPLDIAVRIRTDEFGPFAL